MCTHIKPCPLLFSSIATILAGSCKTIMLPKVTTTCPVSAGRGAELRSVQESEELMVNVAAAFNNLSFYQAESAALRSSQLAIARCKTEGEVSVLSLSLRVGVRAQVSSTHSPPPLSSLSPSLPLSSVCDPVMLKLVFSPSMDAILEAVRVYGNLSQSKDVRDLIMQQKGK